MKISAKHAGRPWWENLDSAETWFKTGSAAAYRLPARGSGAGGKPLGPAFVILWIFTGHRPDFLQGAVFGCIND